jgi:3-hydroxyacyl-[acyl-carrier-protein] dehydratase
MNDLKRALEAAQTGESQPSGQGWVGRTFRFDESFLGFSGHFPGYPIVPAFVEVLASIVVMEQIKKTSLEIRALDNAKFQRELHPHALVAVECRETQDLPHLAFQARIFDENGTAASFSARCVAAKQVEP